MDDSMNGMAEMHNTFWRNDLMMVVFRSDQPLIKDNLPNKNLLDELQLPDQVRTLSQFLQQNQVMVNLTLLDDETAPMMQQPMMEDVEESEGLTVPKGVYLFSRSTPIQTDYGVLRTSVISFLKVNVPGMQDGNMAGTGVQEGGGHDEKAGGSLISRIIGTLNGGLKDLNNGGLRVPIAFSAPCYLSGGTPIIGQGCPLTPPMPVQDSCSDWHIQLPDLSQELSDKRGDGVAVFILDALPERGVIARAARDVRDDNWLLQSVNETVSFDYSLMSGVDEILDMASSGNAGVGKDVYGNHYPILLADHGLYIAGIVRDVAPKARVECVRVLNDLCVGDVNKLLNALWRIYNRMLPVNPDTGKVGDLYQTPVVINLSLVIPTDQEVQDKLGTTSAGGFDIVSGSLEPAILSLTEAGAVIVASAGNEGDLREMPAGSPRPGALYPAAFGNTIDNVIAVGAVNSSGGPTTYSCYPGARGIATYGGEVPGVVPATADQPGSNNPNVTVTDALRGIYSSVEYPPLSAVPATPPEQYYTAPNDHGWAYWIGTSFATPIVSGVAARVLELQKAGALTQKVHDAIIGTGSATVTWTDLDPNVVMGGSASNPVLRAVQVCGFEDCDERTNN